MYFQATIKTTTGPPFKTICHTRRKLLGSAEKDRLEQSDGRVSVSVFYEARLANSILVATGIRTIQNGNCLLSQQRQVAPRLVLGARNKRIFPRNCCAAIRGIGRKIEGFLLSHLALDHPNPLSARTLAASKDCYHLTYLLFTDQVRTGMSSAESDE